jgi:hypothetical protein
VRAIALACVLASGCWLAPPPGAVAGAPADAQVGCISSQRSGKHRTYWIGPNVVPRADVEESMIAEPASHDEATLHRRAERTALVLFLAGMGTALASVGGLVIWAEHEPDSQAPWAMLAPMLAGYAITGTGVGIGVHGEVHWRRAIDAYNEAASAKGRCPP